MQSIEKSARTVDDAITAALIELGMTSDQVEIEILEKEVRGFLGLFTNKKARVRVTPKVNLEDIARDFLIKLFEKMEVEASLEIVYKEKEKILEIEVFGDNMGVIIGKRGQTLDAIQYLTSLVVNKKASHFISVRIDTENYRNRRRETVEELALSLANKVKRTNKKFVLEPMNRNERRIIHSTLQKNKYVKTKSEGEEPYRKIVIMPVSKKKN